MKKIFVKTVDNTKVKISFHLIESDDKRRNSVMGKIKQSVVESFLLGTSFKFINQLVEALCFMLALFDTHLHK